MIISKFVEFEVTGTSHIGYLRKLGINSKYGDIVELEVKFLPPTSSIKILAKCDICENEKETSYHSYNGNYNNGNIYACSRKCSYFKVKKTLLERYGHDNYNNIEKSKKTCLEKYGVEHVLQSEHVKNKILDTLKKQYNVINVSQIQEVKDKIKKKCLDKYGVENISQSEEIKNKKIKTCLSNYGVEYSFQSKEIRDKGKVTRLERYGNLNYNNRYKASTTCLERYGTDNVSKVNYFKEKKIKTCLFNYGVEYPFQSEIIKDKIKKTCLEKYGTEYPMQNKEVLNKQQKNSFKINNYKDTNLYYQGTYELDFINFYFNKIEIKNGHSIKYLFKDKNKIYFPDFYLPEYNLIVEIKSDYIYNLHLEKNLAKQKACIEQGYNFIFIINKDYNSFDKMLFI